MEQHTLFGKDAHVKELSFWSNYTSCGIPNYVDLLDSQYLLSWPCRAVENLRYNLSDVLPSSKEPRYLMNAALSNFCDRFMHGDTANLYKQNIYDFAEVNPDLRVVIYTDSAATPLDYSYSSSFFNTKERTQKLALIKADVKELNEKLRHVNRESIKIVDIREEIVKSASNLLHKRYRQQKFAKRRVCQLLDEFSICFVEQFDRDTRKDKLDKDHPMSFLFDIQGVSVDDLLSSGLSLEEVTDRLLIIADAHTVHASRGKENAFAFAKQKNVLLPLMAIKNHGAALDLDSRCDGNALEMKVNIPAEKIRKNHILIPMITAANNITTGVRMLNHIKHVLLESRGGSLNLDMISRPHVLEIEEKVLRIPVGSCGIIIHTVESFVKKVNALDADHHKVIQRLDIPLNTDPSRFANNLYYHLTIPDSHSSIRCVAYTKREGDYHSTTDPHGNRGLVIEKIKSTYIPRANLKNCGMNIIKIWEHKIEYFAKFGYVRSLKIQKSIYKAYSAIGINDINNVAVLDNLIDSCISEEHQLLTFLLENAEKILNAHDYSLSDLDKYLLKNFVDTARCIDLIIESTNIPSFVSDIIATSQRATFLQDTIQSTSCILQTLDLSLCRAECSLDERENGIG